jgi:transposase
MKVPVALALPNGLAVTEIEMIDEVLTLTAVSVQMRACCPLCGVCASHVHSRYIRRLTDLPCGGQHVCLLVCVRKFFCQVSTCARKIFAERRPTLLLANAFHHDAFPCRETIMY